MSDRLFSAAFNLSHSAPHFPYIFDFTSVITGGGGSLQTGAWRPYSVNDIQNNTVTLTGNGITVTNVAVTGGFVAITNTPTVTIGNSTVPVSGNVNITNAIQAVSGVAVVPYLTGGFSPVFTGISSSQIQIPAGVKSYGIYVVSGTASVQGSLLGQGTKLEGGKYGGGFLLNYPLNVGCSGGYTTIFWEG